MQEFNPRLVNTLFPLAPGAAYCIETQRAEGFTDDAIPMKRAIEAHGYADVFGVLGFNPDGTGTSISTPVRVVDGDADMAASWRRASAHVAAASRLRRRLHQVPGGWEAEAVAIFEGDGRLVHLGDEEEDRAVLTEMVAEHHPRHRAEVEPLRALALWQGLLDGRYTLIEHTDVDDHFYLLLLENDTEALLPNELSRRERQVATYAAFGYDNANIAYTLGLSGSTVSTHLSNAMQKLGVASRAQLIVAFHQLSLDRLVEGHGTLL